MTPAILALADASTTETLLAGVGLALAASACFNIGLALQKRAALQLPRVRGFTPATFAAFLRARRWLLASSLIVVGWVLQFFALRLAPIGIVLPAVASGVVFQAWLAVRFFGEHLGPTEAWGIAACAAGVVLIGISIDPKIEVATQVIDLRALWLVLAVLITSSALGVVAAKAKSHWSETGLALSAGLLYATTGLLTKALGIFGWRDDSRLAALVTLVAMIALGVAAVFVLQAAQQRGRALVIVPLMGVVADFLPALLGPVVFDESWPRGRLAWVRVAALLAIVAGMLLLPRNSEARAKARNANDGPLEH